MRAGRIVPSMAPPPLFWMLRGVSDVCGVQGRCDCRRSSGRHVERSDGATLLRAGIYLSSWRLPSSEFSGVFEPSIRGSIRTGGRSCERQCKRRPHRCNRRRRARHRHRHPQYAYPPLAPGRERLAHRVQQCALHKRNVRRPGGAAARLPHQRCGPRGEYPRAIKAYQKDFRSSVRPRNDIWSNPDRPQDRPLSSALHVINTPRNG